MPVSISKMIRSAYCRAMGIATVSLLVLSLPAFGRTAPRAYVVKQRVSPEVIRIIKRQTGQDVVVEREARDTVRLYDRRTGREIWSYHASNVECSAWSSDGRSYALAFQPYLAKPNLSSITQPPLWEILIWRVGTEPRTFNGWAVTHLDGAIEMHWSPDHRLILVRCQSSGDEGALFCLDARNFHVLSGPVSSYGGACWIGRRTVRCLPYGIWGLPYGESQSAHHGKILVWHVPVK